MSNYGILKNGLPAERQRGLIFCEKFESYAEVQRNGGVVTGTPVIDNGAVFDGTAKNITYDPLIANFVGEITVLATIFVTDKTDFNTICAKDNPSNPRWLFRTDTSGKINAFFSDGVTSGSVGGGSDLTNSWASVAMTLKKNEQKIYANGVLVDSDTVAINNFSPADVFKVGFYGTASDYFHGIIKELRVFNKVLTPEEVLDYYNESVFNYEKDSVLSLPMGLAQHDPSNNRSLDVSGNNNHATFGDGSTSSTFPAKIAERQGYYFDGTAPYFSIDKGVMSECYISNALTVFALFKSEDLISMDYPSIFAIRNGAGLKHLLILKYDTSGNSGIIFTSLNILGVRRDIQVSGVEVTDQSFQTIAMTFDGVNRRVYLNGINVLDSALYSGQLTDLDSDLQIGKEGTTAYFYKGGIYGYNLLSKALTPMQVQDLHNRMMKGINRK